MLADLVDFVIGVDTHKNSHTGAVITTGGAELASMTLPTDAFGNKRMLAWARRHAEGRRVWAIEGTGSFGAGSPPTSSNKANGLSRSTDPPARLGAPAPSPTKSTRCGPLVKH
jgi:hypothetical protein